MNRMMHRAVPVAMTMTILLAFPGAAAARGSIDSQRPQVSFDVRSEGSFLAAVGVCGSPTQPCARGMSLHVAGLPARAGTSTNEADEQPSSRVLSTRSDADPEEPSRAVWGAIGMLLLGCVARLRETRRQPFRLLDSHAH